MADSTTGLALVLLAAFWSGTSAVFTGVKETNSIRDKITTGKIGDERLAVKDRWHAFWCVWAPLKLSLAVISAVLCAVILSLPKLQGGYGNDRSFATVCLVAAAMPAIGTIFQLVSFGVDAAYLRRTIMEASLAGSQSKDDF